MNVEGSGKIIVEKGKHSQQKSLAVNPRAYYSKENSISEANEIKKDNK